jgi:hypothetical protein
MVFSVMSQFVVRASRRRGAGGTPTPQLETLDSRSEGWGRLVRRSIGATGHSVDLHLADLNYKYVSCPRTSQRNHPQPNHFDGSML